MISLAVAFTEWWSGKGANIEVLLKKELIYRLGKVFFKKKNVIFWFLFLFFPLVFPNFSF